MSVDQFEEAKEANQKWKYSNERTSESWRKVEATAVWEQACKRSSRGVRLICVTADRGTCGTCGTAGTCGTYIFWNKILKKNKNSNNKNVYEWFSS